MSPRRPGGAHLSRADTRGKDTAPGLQLPTVDIVLNPLPDDVRARALRNLAGQHHHVDTATDLRALAAALALSGDYAAARALPRVPRPRTT